MILRLNRKVKKPKTFKCKGCGHKLPPEFCMRTKNYCYLCDPNVTLDELLNNSPAAPRKSRIEQNIDAAVGNMLRNLRTSIYKTCQHCGTENCRNNMSCIGCDHPFA
jgi:hypothetical protein